MLPYEILADAPLEGLLKMWFLDFLHMSFPRKRESISLINMDSHFRDC